MNFVAVVTLPRHDVIAFQKESALRGRFLVDPDGRVAAAYDAEACPRIFAIDENKTLVYQSAAALEGSAVDASLQAAIATLARPVADPEFLNP